ncbi:MAG: helix-turn-helix transcriptional regulator [Oscillospiraceae bacterium]|nr:helix-turn-helix transcriptional regulator [Oscillospiraceae bacterium]
MTDKKTFGTFIKTKRTEKNYSQKDLAEILFVTEGAVSKWERGVSYPDITLISDICRVLDISEHELITASIDTDTRKMKHEASKFRAIRGTWFWIPTISYGIALVTCFICNLATDHTLSWFFVVLSALICAYTFVPTVTCFFETKKLFAFTVSTYLSICLLLFTCAVYTNGLSWFLTACVGILMGYVLAFVPILLSKTNYSRYKFIISFTVTLILTILMLMCIRIRQPFMLGNAILMAVYGFAPVIICAAVCTFRIDTLIKAGICSTIIGIELYCANYVAMVMFGTSSVGFYQVDFHNWEQCLNGNIQLIVLLSILFVSAVFFAIGLFKATRNNKR